MKFPKMKQQQETQVNHKSKSYDLQQASNRLESCGCPTSDNPQGGQDSSPVPNSRDHQLMSIREPAELS